MTSAERAAAIVAFVDQVVAAAPTDEKAETVLRACREFAGSRIVGLLGTREETEIQEMKDLAIQASAMPMKVERVVVDTQEESSGV